MFNVAAQNPKIVSAARADSPADTRGREVLKLQSRRSAIWLGLPRTVQFDAAHPLLCRAPLVRQREVVDGERTPIDRLSANCGSMYVRIRAWNRQACIINNGPHPEQRGNRRLTVGRSVDLSDCHVDDPAFFTCAFPAVRFIAGGRPGRCRSSFAASAAATAISDSSRAISPSRTTSLRLTKCPA